MTEDAEANSVALELRPTRFLEKKTSSDNAVAGTDNGFAALIILNSPIDQYEYFTRLYNHASFRICADGGANRLHDLLLKQYSKCGWEGPLRSALPDAIHGDLDSLDKIVRKRYEQLGVEVTKDPDQYSTDFEKAVKKVIERMPHVHDVLVLGSISGRVDQGLGLLGELYREQKLKHSGVRFWLFSEASVSTILRPGTTIIHTPLGEGLIKRSIGVLPIYGPATITLKGLEWDVQDWSTEMGGQMSTSNYIVADQIIVTTDNWVLFTVEKAV